MAVFAFCQFHTTLYAREWITYGAVKALTDLQWIAIALGDGAWVAVAFVMGLASRAVGLPPLVGFLVAGFTLNLFGMTGGESLTHLSDLGITLLLFTVGLKLDLSSLGKPQVWAVTGLHTILTTVLALVGLYCFALTGLTQFAGIDFRTAFLISFALSFSSTVFVVKTLEERGEMASLHGRIAIGILVMQDIIAVGFLAFSTGVWPTIYAPLLVLLIPLRGLIHHLMLRSGHGELLVLFGLLLALGGAALFQQVGLKGDLGALVMGVLISRHAKARELAKAMLGFKDLFLLGFFLSVGLSGPVTSDTLLMGAMLVPFIFIKSALFYALLTQFKLRARTSLLASLNLTNFSEFGLIVAAISAANGWLEPHWLIALAVALALSLAIAAILGAFAQNLYTRNRTFWKRLQRDDLIVDDQLLDMTNATIAVIGMGRVGTGAYDTMREQHGDTVIGVDIDPSVADRQQSTDRRVLHGDPSDADFWDRVRATHTIDLVMLTLPKLAANLAVVEQLKEVGYKGRIAATARYPDEEEELHEAGIKTVFNTHREAGSGFAAHVTAQEPASK